jgi:hypothetical protein
MRSIHLLISASLLAVGCGGGMPTNLNPHQLWLALNGSERAEQLVAMEPVPF